MAAAAAAAAAVVEMLLLLRRRLRQAAAAAGALVQLLEMTALASCCGKMSESVSASANGHHETFVRDFGNGHQVVTFVTWAD